MTPRSKQTSDGTLLVATAGQAIMRSADGGRTWHRLGLRQALEDAMARLVSQVAQA